MIILLGMAGSGKGTQGRALAEILGWRWISVGEVIRASHRYDDVIERGELIPDEDVVQMMHKEIRRAIDEGREVILDGYPRDTIQTEYVTQRYPGQLKLAVVLEVPKEELYVRLALRGRADDKEKDSIERRFGVFEENIKRMLEALEANGTKVRRVDGYGEPEEVTKRILGVLNELDLVGSDGDEEEVLRARKEAAGKLDDDALIRAKEEAAKKLENEALSMLEEVSGEETDD